MHDRLPRDHALDGLRAVAVAAVMAYHGGLDQAGGGFIGVDLFFVLSGYLITSLLVIEHADSGRIDVPAFWSRRIRRLFPALVVMVAWVVVDAALWSSTAGDAGVRGDAVATLFHGANWQGILSDENYFAQFAAPSPLLHAWSLSIEEQWYLVWPLLMVAWTRWGRGRLVVGLIGVTLATIGSAVAMALLFDASDPSRAYYGTDTRAQALLIGSGLAFALMYRPTGPDRSWSPSVARIVGSVGVAASIGFVLLAGFVRGTDRWMYHGGFTAVAVVSAVIIASVRLHPAGLLAGVLRLHPLPLLGRLSYSLYLWHWPVFVFLDPDRVGTAGWSLFAIRVAVSVAVAALSYVIVEQPMRAMVMPPRRSLVSSVAAASVLALLAVAAVPAGSATPSRVRIVAAPAEEGDATPAATPPAPSPTAQPTPTDPGTTPPAATSVPEPTPIPRPSFPPVVGPGETTRILVVGDSVYLDLALGFDPSRHREGATITADVRLGCGTIPTLTLADDCDDRVDSWAASVEADQPDIVLLGLSKWDLVDFIVDGDRLRFGTDEHRRHLLESLETNIEILGRAGARVVIVGLPCLQFRENALGGLVSEVELRIRTDPARRMEFNRMVRRHVASSRLDVQWLDLGRLTCPDGEYLPELDGRALHLDGIHYTPEAIPLIWDWLVPRLDRLARAG